MPIPIIAAIASKVGLAKAGAAVAAKAGAAKVAAGAATKAAVAKTAVASVAKQVVAKEGLKGVAKESLTKLKSIPGSVKSNVAPPKLGKMKMKEVPSSSFQQLAAKMKEATNGVQGEQKEQQWSEREGNINNLTPEGVPFQNPGAYQQEIDLLKP